mgnify:CR=1 FL=1
MKPSLCSRCGKNVAVIFITKVEGSQTKTEGLCLKCAKELGIKPVNDMLTQLGVGDDDIDKLSEDLTSTLGNSDELASIASMLGAQSADENDGDDEDDTGRTATFPFLNQLFGAAPPAQKSEQGETPPPRGDKSAAPKAPKRKYLSDYCISLTQKARDGKLDQLVGREREIQRVIQILNRRQKNNPCLIGEPGVGKTAIAEGLALAIEKKQVPYKLLDKEVYLLDLTALVAGTQFRGQFESRMKGLIEEIRRIGNIILVIDEVHTIVGAGDAEGSMNAANILKPALSRGEIQVIGATTLTEYRKHIEKDSALERRFQPVLVEEPSIADSVKILEGIAPYYANFHRVTISKEMCRMAVTMSERYITDRYLPDKAIDLLDEACSCAVLRNKRLSEYDRAAKEMADKTETLEELEADAEHNPDYERIARLKGETILLDERLKELAPGAVDQPVTMDDLARVVELWTGIPAAKIRETELRRVAKLEPALKARRRRKKKAAPEPAAQVLPPVEDEPLDDYLPQRPKLTRPGTLLDTGDAMPNTEFTRPDPLDSDVIMDATARLLAPRKPLYGSSPVRDSRPVRKEGSRRKAAPQPRQEEQSPAPEQKPPKKRRSRKKSAAQPADQQAAHQEQARKERSGRGKKHSHDRGGRGPMEPHKSGQTKDSTEQASLIKPFYINVGR